MKISSVLAGFIATVSAFVPMNVINNHEKCGLGLNQTRKICAACSVIGQLSMANQNRQMRLKLACLSLISNQCCSETTNRFLHWIFIQNTNDLIINWKKLFMPLINLCFVQDGLTLGPFGVLVINSWSPSLKLKIGHQHLKPTSIS